MTFKVGDRIEYNIGRDAQALWIPGIVINLSKARVVIRPDGHITHRSVDPKYLRLRKDAMDLNKVPHRELLTVLHAMEMSRLMATEVTGRDNWPALVAPWPDGYEVIVAEAQRRKLCL